MTSGCFIIIHSDFFGTLEAKKLGSLEIIYVKIIITVEHRWSSTSYWNCQTLQNERTITRLKESDTIEMMKN